MKEILKKKKDNLLFAEFARKQGQLVLRIKVDQEIENFFKNENIATSEIYKNSRSEHKNYYKYDDKQSELYQEIEQEIHRKTGTRVTLRYYGSRIIYDNTYNLSVLRTVNISKTTIEIVIQEFLSMEQMKKWVEILRIAVGYIYKNYIKPVRITCKLEVEEVL